ncbi:MAG: CAP domain-containing protein [Clostridiales bacterium]|nr:CAP domain-containing protein [Clostridiales bacterium]MDR2752579.1 CAP domain-containing protein [Clostridiales bacterium]
MKSTAYKSAIAVLLLAFVIAPTNGFGDPGIKVFVTGVQAIFDVPPAVVNDRIMIPVRTIAEMLGATTYWDGALKKATFYKGNTEVLLTAGSDTMLVTSDGVVKQSKLDSPPFIKDGRVLAPLRAIAEAFDATVEFEATSNVVRLTPATAERTASFHQSTIAVQATPTPVPATPNPASPAPANPTSQPTPTLPPSPSPEPTTTPQPSPSPSSFQSLADEVVRLTNEERVRYGLKPLQVHSGLQDIAMQRAAECIDLFAHERKDGSTVVALVNGKGIKWTGIGENIAYGQKTPERVVQVWMESPSHRVNILSDRFNYIGIGVTRSGSVYYWSQVFIQ